VVKDDIGIALVTCCKHYDLKISVYFPQAFKSTWSNVDSSIDHFTSWERYRQDYVRVCGFNVVSAVNKSLVKVKNNGLTAVVTRALGQANFFRP
jgi:hypothetical protein